MSRPTATQDRMPRALATATQDRMPRAFAAVALALVAVLPAPVLAETPTLAQTQTAAAAPTAPAAGGVSIAGGSQHGVVRDLGRGPADATKPSGRAYVDGVVLVGYLRGAKAAARAADRDVVGATGHRALSPRARDVERITLPKGESVDAAVKALQRSPGVRFAEPDYVITTEHTPNDDIYQSGDMWNMRGDNSNPAGFGSAAAEAWADNQVGSRSVYVGIVDTGVDINHPDLKPNIWTNPYETPGNGIDDDGNGYVDDVHGWDFFHDDASVFDATASDYHGTHVAGTIGAAGANTEGVVGVNWAVTMIPAKFIDGEGTVSGAVAALDYITDLKTRHGLNIVATNDSWGEAHESSALEDAINRGGDAGILFVAAAGNDGVNIDTTPTYPAANTCDTRSDNHMARGYDCLITVAAMTDTAGLASFSNYGSTSVDLGAPGDRVASTYPGKQYAYLSGTSMAAPHVTGAIALLAACQAGPTAGALRQSLLDTVVALPALSGKTVTGGSLQIDAMMADCDTGAPPRVLLTTRAGAALEIPSFFLWFSEPVTGLDALDLTIGGTSPGWTVSTISSFDAGAAYVVGLSASSPVAGTVTLTLNAGSVMGVSQAGPAAAATTTQLIDLTNPSTTAPSASIKSGVSLSGSAIPVHLGWTGSDTGGGVRYYVLSYSTNGGSHWTVLDDHLVTSSVELLLDPIGTFRFRVQAVDWADRGSTFGVGPTLTPRLVQELSTSISYAGSWAKGSSPSFSGGGVRYTSVGGRSATLVVTARSIAFTTTLASARGVVKVYVDGVYAVRIDLRKPLAYRRLVWARTFATLKSHKIKILVVGGYGRVDLDAFAVLK